QRAEWFDTGRGPANSHERESETEMRIAKPADRHSCEGDCSESRWLDPKAGFPLAARRNRLQFFVKALVCKVHRVGNSRHRLERDEVRVGARIRRAIAAASC